MKLKSILLLSASVLIFGNSYGQSKVSTGGKKYTLLEESTGTWCQWCTDGAQVIEADIVPHGADTNYPRAIIASFHNGGSDLMTLPGDPFGTGTGFISGWPGGTVDRAPYSGNVSLGRNSWESAVIARNGLTPNFDVSMECVYNDSTRILSIKVTAKALVALTGNYRMSAYITQDSIPSNNSGYRQQNASGLNAGTTPSSANSGVSWYIGKGTTIADSTVYSHMAVVRKILATDSLWGDAAFTNTTVGQTVTKTYTYTLPTTVNGSVFHSKATKVIGLVMKYGSSTSDRAIENSMEARVRWMKKSVVNVNEVSKSMLDIRLFPNPANNFIVVTGILENPSDTKITIYDILGQVVLQKDYKAGGSLFGEKISLANISNGNYFMTITNEGETITKQFVVAK
ncbi:MAG: hypothetical protein K0Q79_1491 [Flavipsychrobacter sp.]|jgi:hypothetical protein|nr:hypothetical protein [Flavipsychrobacter sp.]